MTGNEKDCRAVNRHLRSGRRVAATVQLTHRERPERSIFVRRAEIREGHLTLIDFNGMAWFWVTAIWQLPILTYRRP